MLPTYPSVSRRGALRTIVGLAAAAGTAGCADLIPQSVGLALTPSPLTDPSV